MNKKIDLDELIIEMKRKFPGDTLSEFEKIRYLYIELGKLLSFDINYVSVHDRKSEDVYWREVNFDNIDRNEFICRQISDMYAELLKRAGVSAESVWKPMLGDDDDFDPTFRHKYIVVKLSDGREFITDLVYDMPFVQKGYGTMFFGTTEEELLPNIQKIDSLEIEAADKKIGYSFPKDLNKTAYTYTDNFIQMLKADMQNEEHLRDYVAYNFSEEEARNLKKNSLIKYKFDIMSRFFTVSDMGFREGRMVLEKIFLDFFTEEEKKEISLHDLITEHEEYGSYLRVGNTDMMKCFVWKKSEDDYEYYVFEKGKNLRNMTKEELQVLVKQEGFSSLSRYKKVPGIEDTEESR